MVDSHSLSVVTSFFGAMLFILSAIVMLEYGSRRDKCHGYYTDLRSRQDQGSFDNDVVCRGDDVIFGSAATLVGAAVIQLLGGIPAWYNYWKAWCIFQVILLLISGAGFVLPFALEGLEGFGGPEDIKILFLSAFAGIEFIFAFLSLFVMSYLQFQ